MKQVVSLIAGDRVQYALVDDADGSLIPFADILIPNPERFGLHDAALLGTNLIEALGLNGHRKPAVRAQEPRNEPAALPAAPKTAVTPQRRRRAPSGITMERVLAVIAQYPDGITSHEIAEALVDGAPSKSEAKAVDNRVGMAIYNHKHLGRPLPFRVANRAEGRYTRRYLSPL
jgi:hypothetical protein